MIRHEQKLNNVDGQLTNVIQTLHWGIGRFDIHILVAGIQESEWSIYELQGGNLNELNTERIKFGIHAMDSKANVKIVEPNWISSLKNGRGVVVVFGKKDFRVKSDSQIENGLDWLVEKFPTLIVEKCENKKFDSFLLTFTKPKVKKQPVEIKADNEEIQINETSV